MQTMTTTTATVPYRLPFPHLRWSAVVAGLVVGFATNLLLLLLGAAVGLAVFDVGETGGAAVSVAAGTWNTVSMVVAAYMGGYVAARTAGMRRNSDGVLHGMVAWGVTMVVSALVATTAASGALGGLFGALRGEPEAAGQVVGSLQEGDRQAAADVLQQRLGLSPEQASRAVDQALILSGRPESASPEGREAAEQAIRTASVTSAWLSAAILLSLLAAIGGGVVGAHGVRRWAPGEEQPHIQRAPPPVGTAHVK